MVELQENLRGHTCHCCCSQVTNGSVRVLHDGSINVAGTVDGESKIAKMENRGDKLTHLCDVSLGEAHRLECNFELLEPMCVVTDAVWTGP